MSRIEALIDTNRQRYYTQYVEAVQALYPKFIEELWGYG
jgi:hypothetical protein